MLQYLNVSAQLMVWRPSCYICSFGMQHAAYSTYAQGALINNNDTCPNYGAIGSTAAISNNQVQPDL
jgi:hypothetical protein